MKVQRAVRGAPLRDFALLVAVFTPLAMVLSRGIAPLLLGLIASILFVALIRSGDFDTYLARTKRLSRSPRSLTVCLAITSCLVSSILSPTFPTSLVAAIQLAIIAALVTGMIAFALRESFPVRLAKVVLLLSLTMTSLLIASELQFGSPLRSALGGSSELFRLNRAAVAIAIMSPILLLPLQGTPQRIASLLVLCAIVVACFASISESAKLAVIVAVSTWLFCKLVPLDVSARVIFACIIGTLALSPLIAFGIYQGVPPQFYEAIGYPYQFTRSEIWWAFTELTFNRPLLGHGFGASEIAPLTYPNLDAETLQLIGMSHPHNFSVQVWYELGAIGVALFVAVLSVIYFAVTALPEETKAVALAMATSTWTVALVSHGAWQPWWWSLVAIAAFLFVAMTATARTQHGEGQP